MRAVASTRARSSVPSPLHVRRDGADEEPDDARGRSADALDLTAMQAPVGTGGNAWFRDYGLCGLELAARRSRAGRPRSEKITPGADFLRPLAPHLHSF